MPTNWFIPIGSVLAALAVALGAIGAHALEKVLDPKSLDTFHKAVDYQMIHSIGLILIGILSLTQRSVLLDVAGWIMLVGIVLFSGFLYVWVMTGYKPLVFFVPVGGVSFIVAWLILAAATMRIVGKS